MKRRSLTVPLLLASLAVCGLFAAAAAAEDSLVSAVGGGDSEKGFIAVPLYRGVAVPFELTVVATPNNCRNNLMLTMRWNKNLNKVWVRLTGPPGSLERFPDVDRTAGVDYFPNPFFPEPEDYENGRYQLWIIGAGGPPTAFFYDPNTLDLLGSALDFETPPPNAIVQPFPTLFMFATPTFQPKADGSVELDWQFDYAAPGRGDRPEYSYHIVTFPPPNLCGANPFRLDLSTLRPYIADPFPASQAVPWSDYLRNGLLFDVTIEPPEYFSDPPLTSLVATYSGATAVAGGVPKGWNFDIDAAFGGNAPPIKPWAGRGSCSDQFAGVHTHNLNFCQP
jgi:hypothetical protein